jgi:hypothetical protein
METENFIITGFGRSGTKFLSKIMNRSKIWTVFHEPRGAMDELYKNNPQYCKTSINPIFKRNQNYGEVNSYLRFHFDSVDVNKKGILLRNPLKIYTSVMNRKNYITKYKYFADQINYWYFNFDKILREQEGVVPIVFEKMTTNSHYLKKILNEFGINDVHITDQTLIKKINPNKIIKYPTFDSLPSNVQEYAKTKLNQHEKIIHNF